MTPLRMAIYIPNFYGGGAERMALMLIDAFIARGVDLSVVVNLPSGALRALLPNSVRLVSLESRRSLTALPRLARHLRADRPDVLLSSLGHNNIIALWARLLSGAPTKIVICQHNALSAQAREMGNWQHRLLPWLYRAFAGRADAIVGVSHGVSDDMARVTALPPARITTLHNPVLDAQFESALTEPSTHRWLHDPLVKVIVGIGRLVPQKDFATLVDAFARLSRADTRLLILGEGPERERLQALAAARGIADRIDLAGFHINPLPTLRDADVMVMSSIYEGFGNVLVEALAAGVPVVSTRCPFGPDEILDDGRFGELVPVGDAVALAQAIARQLESPRPAQAVRQARARDFHVDLVSQRYLALFASLHPAAAQHLDGLGLGRDIAAKRPRIVIYSPHLRMGGAELSLARLAGGLAERGLDVTFVVHHSCDRAIELPAAVKLVSLDMQRTLFATWHLVRLLRRVRPDVLLTALPHTNVMAVVARALSGIDCRLVISEHAPVSQQVARMGGWRYRLLPPFARWAYPRADAVVAVSQGVLDDLRSVVPACTDTRVVFNPVLPADWAARAAEAPSHPWLLDASLDVVLSVSRLSVEKDIAMLVRAFAIVAAARPAARLLIAGEGPERAVLEAQVEALSLRATVQFAGHVANPLSWMRRARVFALASQYEGFGNVLIEALAAGTPVVSTDCPVGPREVLQEGRLGTLVPVGDAPAMAAAIECAMRSGPLPATARDAALRFTQERSCSAYLALFAELGRRGA